MKNYKVYVNGQAFDVTVLEEDKGTVASVIPSKITHDSGYKGQPLDTKSTTSVLTETPSGPTAESIVKAPMPGIILSVKVSPGQAVKKGQVLMILEAMKMENEICAATDGTIKSVYVKSGQSVNTGDLLVEFG